MCSSDLSDLMTTDGRIPHTWSATVRVDGKKYRLSGTDRMFMSGAPSPRDAYIGNDLEDVVRRAADKEFGAGKWAVTFDENGKIARWAVPASDYGWSR